MPAEWADCELLLIPKPGKVSKRPKDLRLGLQDPGGKSIATALKDRLLPMVWDALWSTPQYAYVTNRAIDEAIYTLPKNFSYFRTVPCRAVPP